MKGTRLGMGVGRLVRSDWLGGVIISRVTWVGCLASIEHGGRGWRSNLKVALRILKDAERRNGGSVGHSLFEYVYQFFHNSHIISPYTVIEVEESYQQSNCPVCCSRFVLSSIVIPDESTADEAILALNDFLNLPDSPDRGELGFCLLEVDHIIYCQVPGCAESLWGLDKVRYHFPFHNLKNAL